MRRPLIAAMALVLLVGSATALTDGASAGAAPPSGSTPWSVDQITVKEGGPQLTGLDCADTEADGVCLAVGFTTSFSQSRHVLVERRTGAGWVEVPAAEPHGASDATLSAISCLSSTRCVAVGRAAYGRNVRTVVEQSTSAGWRLEDSPRPGTTVAELASVSCVSKTFCVAVGDAGSRTTRSALIEAWDGAQWRLLDAPDTGLPSTQLFSVDCTSPAFCVAVGAAGPSATQPTTLVQETWNGSTWTSSTSGTGISAELTSVDCTSTTFCMAVGDLQSRRGPSLVARRWDGTSWAAESVPSPSGSDARLATISCTSPAYCLALGHDLDDIIGGDSYAVAWDGQQAAFRQASAPFYYDPLDAVRCFSASECVGVGRTPQVLHGSDWEFENAPQLSGGTRPTTLQAVACMTSTACLAAGSQYEDAEPLGLQSSGAKWRFAAAWQEGFGVADNAVSCGSTEPTSCLLSGSIDLHTGHPRQTEVERFDGGYFAFEPGVPDVGASKALSCTGSFCVVAGVHAVAMFDGTSWSSMPIRGPAGSRVDLDGVDCVSADDCVLVGGYRTSDPKSESALVERWDGTSWSPVAVPVGRPGRRNTLRAVDCTSASSCVAVGTANGASDSSLVYQWDGTTWQSVTHPSTGTGLASVACAAAGSCIAVGADGAAIASADGTWARTHIAVPPGDTGALPELTGITSRDGSYRVVGWYDRLGDRTALAETLSG